MPRTEDQQVDPPDIGASEVSVGAGRTVWRPAVTVAAAVLFVVSVHAEIQPSADLAGHVLGPLLFAAVLGAPLFVWVATARSRIARPVGVGMTTAMLCVYGLSRWQPGSIAPPQWDWMIVFAWLALPACAVGLWRDRRLVRGAGPPLRSARHPVAAVVLLVAALCTAGPVAAINADRYKSGLGSLSVDPEPGEIGTLPDGLTVVDVHTSGGSAGYDSVLFAVTGPTGAHREQVAARLREHLLAHGWAPAGTGWHGDPEYTKPVGGILDWHHHITRVSTDPDLARSFSPPAPAGAVFVWLTSWTPIEGG